MRLFEVLDAGGRPVACVFADYRTGEAFCRTKSLSFLSAYDACAKRESVVFARDGGALVVKDFGPQNFDWIDRVLKKVCSDFWSYTEREEFWGDVDARVSKFFSSKKAS